MGIFGSPAPLKSAWLAESPRVIRRVLRSSQRPPRESASEHFTINDAAAVPARRAALASAEPLFGR